MAGPVATRQSFLPGLCPLAEAVASLATSGAEQRGAVNTRREVAEFILDLVGYVIDRPLWSCRLLEPSFGEGAFLTIVLERLLASWQRDNPREDPVTILAPCIRGVELHAASFNSTRACIVGMLKEAGIDAESAERLANTWLVNGDFLLADFPFRFDFAVGNPPYLRQELIPDVLVAEYRARYHTMFDRADIYIPFIERSLTLLDQEGVLGFICADRWMKNRYGGPLRNMIADNFWLKAYIDMTEVPAFDLDVIAYPAITIISKQEQGKTRLAYRPRIDRVSLGRLAEQMTGETLVDGETTEAAGIVGGSRPWIMETSSQLDLVRLLERKFPTIEAAGCKVGIGVATGADGAFIGPYKALDVEDDRKLPLVGTRDIESGEVNWRGFGVINPFTDDGQLVSLDDFPRLRVYLEARREQIAGRHVARKNPVNWFRTIDRIHPTLARQPKLLIPDIKSDAHVVHEKGRFYPHHNLYFIISSEWDLVALRAVLRSGIAKLFVSAYATRMRGNYLRFQAQYLRRIRLPRWQDIDDDIRVELQKAATQNDDLACSGAVSRLYGLSAQELVEIGNQQGREG